MGVNATTFVPTYVSGEVLTAADLNVTNSGIPVFATSVERDAAFGGTGEKTLAEGQYAYLESTKQTLVYDGSSWIAVGASGLTLISSTTIGSAVASVTVSSVFSSTYDAYKIVVSGGAASVVNSNLDLKLGSTTTNYYQGQNGAIYSTAASAPAAINNGAAFTVGFGQTDGLNTNMEIINPFLAKRTFVNGSLISTVNARNFSGFQDSNTSFTEFTITPSSGTLTGGTIRVYGYANS